MEKYTESMIRKALSVAYDKAINGFEVQGFKILDSSFDLARDYSNPDRSVKKNATSLINWQCTKAGVSGFATSLGGFASMAVGIPANVTSVLYIQLRMIVAIAIMAGYDPHNDKVQTFAYACLLGNSAGNVLKEVGMEITEKLTSNYIKKNVTREMLKKINDAIVPRLITKAGSKGIINLTKTVPVISGIFGASFDVITTKGIGAAAKKMFIDGKI